MSRPVPPSGPLPARIMLCGEAPGYDEERLGLPFVGASGNELTRMMGEVGLLRGECFITNMCKIRPPQNNIYNFIAKAKKDITKYHVEYRGRMVLPPVIEGIELLKTEMRACNPNLIIAMGNWSMWSLTGRYGITDWRGSILPSDLVPGYKVLCTYHPAAILRQWSWRPALLQDLRRAKSEAEYREIKDYDWRFMVSPDIQTVLRTLRDLALRCEIAPLLLSVDIETSLHFITCIGLAWTETEAICIPFTSSDNDDGYWSAEEEALIVEGLRRLLTHPQCLVIGQNFLYDAQHIYRWWGFIPHFYNDTMFDQHLCFPGLPKSLDFQSSMYNKYYRYWKDRSIYNNVEKRDA